MINRVASGPALSRVHEEQHAVTRSVTALVEETATALRPRAARVLFAILDFPLFALGHGYASLRETLTWDWPAGPVLPGLHLWLRRVIAHTLVAGDGASAADRDTAVLAALCLELGVCAESPPVGLSVFDLIEHGALPRAAALAARLADGIRQQGVSTADDDMELTRVLDTVRALELHPWIPVSTPAAAIARAGRASAVALVGMSDATGVGRAVRRASLERVDFSCFGAVDWPTKHPVAEPLDLPF